jgi:hypothetical protein
MSYTIQVGSRFQYNNPVNIYQSIIIIVTDIQIEFDDGEISQTLIFFQNNHEKATYRKTAKEICGWLEKFSAVQIA